MGGMNGRLSRMQIKGEGWPTWVRPRHPLDRRRTEAELISQDALLWRIEPTIPSRSFIWHPAAKLPVRVVFERTTECLELPQEQTSVSASLMSANDPKQTLRERPNGRERVCSGFAINRY